MLPIATDVTRSVGCVLVSLTDIPCKNGWTDQDAVWGLTLVGPRNHILYGGWDSPWQGAILGLSPAHWKALGVCGDYVTRDNSIVNNGMTAWLPQLGVTFPPPREKSSPCDEACRWNFLTTTDAVARSIGCSLWSRLWALQNDWTDRDAVWDEDLDGPKEPRVRRESRSYICTY